jgi:hypothetical protein
MDKIALSGGFVLQAWLPLAWQPSLCVFWLALSMDWRARRWGVPRPRPTRRDVPPLILVRCGTLLSIGTSTRGAPVAHAPTTARAPSRGGGGDGRSRQSVRRVPLFAQTIHKPCRGSAAHGPSSAGPGRSLGEPASRLTAVSAKRSRGKHAIVRRQSCRICSNNSMTRALHLSKASMRTPRLRRPRHHAPQQSGKKT